MINSHNPSDTPSDHLVQTEDPSLRSSLIFYNSSTSADSPSTSSSNSSNNKPNTTTSSTTTSTTTSSSSSSTSNTTSTTPTTASSSTALQEKSTDIIMSEDSNNRKRKCMEMISSITPTIKERDSSLRFNKHSALRKTRSKSLPNIEFPHRRKIFNNNHNNLNKRKKTHHHNRYNNLSFNGSDNSGIPLPPVNTQSLREIDLHEILKNPQLRHDILFDPQLQFRPNLDGERGKRKKQLVDKYWKDIESECYQYMKPNNVSNNNNTNFNYKFSKLPQLFTTLRDILISLLPTNDKPTVYDVMDVDLLVQQLRKGVVDFVTLAKWLSNVFKNHCAPMRDSWVDEMTQKFVEANKENSIKKLIDGIRTIFNILEAMKLDVANHQIRVLRPALIETAVTFEKDYFNQMILRGNMNINESLNWFKKNYMKEKGKINKHYEFNNNSFDEDLKIVNIVSVIKLLSCREMVNEFPVSLSFDHSRLILLRADVRQLVCLQICLYLFKQLILTFNKDLKMEDQKKLLSKASLIEIKKEILAVITDENGNVKWTKNIPSIAIQLAKKAVINNSNSTPPNNVVNFAHNWLLKQTQPKSEVYGLIEEKIFLQLKNQIITINKNEKNALNSSNNTPTSTTTPTNNTNNNVNEEIISLSNKLAVLINFHWSVFGSHYIEAIRRLK